ncbi:protein of unknown function [Tenacibaculum sp. 190524A02b]|uniref:NTF2 fold immunity protein n=1 Tax=Tenacibaculum vairaonense TaxID=3137860 RepID=UPI0032B21502
MKKSIIFSLLLASIVLVYFFNKNKKCIASKADAIKLAKNEWIKIFGSEILKKKPFVLVNYNNDIWHIEGTLHTDSGGVPHIKIRGKDCEIIEIYHTK